MKISPEDEQRAIQLADAAGRATFSGEHTLGAKFAAHAMTLLGGAEPDEAEQQERFEYHFARVRLLNIDKYDGKYVSKNTQEFWQCWRLAQTSGEVPTE